MLYTTLANYDKFVIATPVLDFSIDCYAAKHAPAALWEMGHALHVM